MAQTPEQQEPPRFMRLREVERATGFKRTRIYDLAREGRFPRPVKLGERATAWVASEIIAWCEARIAERDAGRQRWPDGRSRRGAAQELPMS